MGAACSQLWVNLRALGDPEPKVNKTRIRGLIQGATSLDPVEAILSMREHLRSDPHRYDKLFRIMPILSWVDTEIEAIVAEIRAQKASVGEEDSFRVTVEKRGTHLSSREIIEAAADVFNNRVDLENPDWVVLIEIMGKRTGVSVVRNEALLNIQKERAALAFKADQGALLRDDPP